MCVVRQFFDVLKQTLGELFLKNTPSLCHYSCSMTVGFTFTEAAAVKPPSQVTRTVNTTPLDKPETGE